MLTPYDFSVITSLRLSDEKIHVNDTLASNEIKKFLGTVRSKRGVRMFLCLGYESIFPNVILRQRVPVCSRFFSLGLSCARI